ncbi:MAG: hypothetical protein Q7U02_10895 [Desulfosalsimonadaceae bacterium]|nr:hypothetical protein [Desulfosalsimonadaceae bacterium]
MNEGMTSDALRHRILEINKASDMIEPDAGQLPQEKIIAQYSGVMAQFVQKAAIPELFTGRDKLYELSSDTRTQLKPTVAQWMAHLGAKRQEYQAIIDNLDYIATHPNY